MDTKKQEVNGSHGKNLDNLIVEGNMGQKNKCHQKNVKALWVNRDSDRKEKSMSLWLRELEPLIWKIDNIL